MERSAIGQQIKMARENAHITQEALAAAIGCTPQHVSAIERGIKVPRLDTFVEIANALHISADTLLQDVLECCGNPMAGAFASAMAGLSGKEQRCILKAIRGFCEEAAAGTED